MAEIAGKPRRLRIALSTDGGKGIAIHPDCVAAAEDAAKLCAELGHEVERADPPIDHDALWEAFRTIIAGNVANTVALREKALGRAARPDELEASTQSFRALGRDRLTAADYARAVLSVHVLGRRLGAFMDRFDVLLTPTLAKPPATLSVIDMMEGDLDRFVGGLRAYIPFTPVENAAGLPAISLPLAWNAAGLPIGVQCVGRYADEAMILALAAQLEAARPWGDRRPPVS
jgi:Asp-tRNA(Asn)/Glu-tRNA(Gln) amidotransferase A subunit family amidase